MPYAQTFTFPTTGALQAAGDGYRIMLAPINVPSDDGRVIVNQLGSRAGRLPLFFSDSEAGHDDAVHVGTFGTVQVAEFGGELWAYSDDVVWDSDDTAREAQRLVDSDQFRGVSIHMSKGEFDSVCPDGSGGFTRITEDDITFDEESGALSLPCESPLLGAFEAEIGAVTIVGIPAFSGSKIEPQNETVQAAVENASDGDVEFSIEGDYIVARTPLELSEFGPLDTPDPEWFTDPAFGTGGEDSRLVYDDRHDQWGCPLTVTDDGRIFGHLALWRTCHTGYRDRCVTAPRGADMAPFYQCRVTTADGETLPVGPLVVDEGHAPVAWSTDRVSRHYADTTLVAGYVRAGEDEHGIWVAGALSPRATPEMVDTLKRHSLSGDWRPRDGRYELIAAVSVNSPGFPVPQVLVASSGEPAGLITFGAPNPLDEETSDLGLVVAALERMNKRLDRFEVLFRSDDELVTVEGDDETEPAVTGTDETVVDVSAFLAEEVAADITDLLADEVG